MTEGEKLVEINLSRSTYVT